MTPGLPQYDEALASSHGQDSEGPIWDRVHTHEDRLTTLERDVDRAHHRLQTSEQAAERWERLSRQRDRRQRQERQELENRLAAVPLTARQLPEGSSLSPFEWEQRQAERERREVAEAEAVGRAGAAAVRRSTQWRTIRSHRTRNAGRWFDLPDNETPSFPDPEVCRQILQRDAEEEAASASFRRGAGTGRARANCQRVSRLEGLDNSRVWEEIEIHSPVRSTRGGRGSRTRPANAQNRPANEHRDSPPPPVRPVHLEIVESPRPRLQRVPRRVPPPAPFADSPEGGHRSVSPTAQAARAAQIARAFQAAESSGSESGSGSQERPANRLTRERRADSARATSNDRTTEQATFFETIRTEVSNSRRQLRQIFLRAIERIHDARHYLSVQHGWQRFVGRVTASGAFENEQQVNAAWRYAFREPTAASFGALFTGEPEVLRSMIWR